MSQAKLCDGGECYSATIGKQVLTLTQNNTHRTGNQSISWQHPFTAKHIINFCTNYVTNGTLVYVFLSKKTKHVLEIE